MRRLFAFLVLASLLHAASQPLYSYSYANANENKTTYTFRTENNAEAPTSSFRIHISSGFSWFDTNNFTYPLEPDFMDGKSAYWDIPPLLPNETAEVSFTVDRLVGLPEEIEVWSEDISNWTLGCPYLAAMNSSAGTYFKVRDYLDATNTSQGVAIYYEENNLALVKLDKYGAFSVFSVNESGAYPVSDKAGIDALVDSYVLAKSPEQKGNASALYPAILNTRSAKYKAEHECYLLTGMASYPCVDRDSCLYACFSVPVCSLIGQSGWDFMDTVLDYNVSVTEANAALNDAEASSYLLAQQPDYFSAKTAFDDLINLNREAGDVMFHPLIASYGFCEPPDYGIPMQIGAKRELMDYLGSRCLIGEGERIKGEALRVAPLLAKRPDTRAQATETASESISIVQNSTFEISAPDTDRYSCCAWGVCSLFGIDKPGGLCWQWYAILIPSAAIMLYAAWKASS